MRSSLSLEGGGRGWGWKCKQAHPRMPLPQILRSFCSVQGMQDKLRAPTVGKPIHQGRRDKEFPPP